MTDIAGLSEPFDHGGSRPFSQGHSLYPRPKTPFRRIDEDLTRVLQTFKSEVKNIAKKKGFEGDSLWQWQFDEE
jgi:hypothetical protein